MKYNRYLIFSGLAFIAASLSLESCAPAGGNKPGHEYMQDMGHSIAYEANMVDLFHYNRWDMNGYIKLAQPRNPVMGTIPRGFVGLAKYSNSEIPASVEAEFANETVNGSVPFYYGDTEEDRKRAENDIKLNPYPITKENLAHGKELYDIYCGICHGEKGDGSGYLVRDDGKYPAQPAILTSDEFIAASNGRFYFAIMHGKNVMGSYSDKLSYMERWQVIQYIRSLQAKTKGLKYDETENTLNNTDFIASAKKAMPAVADTMPTVAN
ncbi:MAG TPA: cytochrome c [Saprospiraceae bacterium]|mgnify:FL=1|nr:cytochrome c [Saprospiraceae bacterium]HRN33031.1 cytochrome c [Saprospiraceae bacterium]HRP84120.1 cytochrome c [Saprospiraceae bacterium]